VWRCLGLVEMEQRRVRLLLEGAEEVVLHLELLMLSPDKRFLRLQSEHLPAEHLHLVRFLAQRVEVRHQVELADQGGRELRRLH
jgi:hypothetical protein